jgi:putative two-component system response regulator
MSMSRPAIICVDDEKIILDSLRSQFNDVLDQDIKLELAESAEEALDLVTELFNRKIDLAVVISDYLMPGMKGDEFLIRLHRISPKTMKILLTGQAGIEALGNAVNNAHLYRYITKPWDFTDLYLTVKEALGKFNQDRIIEEKNIKIEKLTIALTGALENANSLYDNYTGSHIKQVSSYATLIAAKSGFDEDYVKRIKIYSTLHDIGKVGIKSSILNKPGQFTDEEFKIMQEHVIYGSRILSSNDIDIMAKNIALYHHEKWDGTGYMYNLKGEAIPLEARIVALADVFDALTTKRAYKEALTAEEAYEVIKGEKGKHFDPSLVDVFLKYFDQVLNIKANSE